MRSVYIHFLNRIVIPVQLSFNRVSVLTVSTKMLFRTIVIDATKEKATIKATVKAIPLHFSIFLTSFLELFFIII